MRFLLRTLSLSYVSRHRAKTLLTLLGVVVGVATFGAIRGARSTLVGGIRGTVDRMAGKAQLQIASEGGVPEEVLEAIRELPGVRATSPVIEQIVVPERGELGSLLVLGVDLVGDREMRDYAFEGDDVDLDDPLLFLAQPDSVALARPLAARAGVAIGDTLALKLPLGTKRVTVRGLLTPKGFAEAFGGNLVVLDVYAAQTLFGRGRRFDRIEARLDPGVSIEAGTETLQRAVGPGYRVETPDRRGGQLEKLITNFTAGFNVSSVFALGIGVFLIFNAFTVAVNRRRRDVGTLRALGATPRQVQVLFLLEGVAIGVVGGAVGLLAGISLTRAFLSMMSEASETLFGVASRAEPELTAALAVEALLLGVGASFLGAFLPARAASRIHPTEAFAKGAHQAAPTRRLGSRLAVGAALLLGAAAVGLTAPMGGEAQVFGTLLLGGAGVVLLSGPLSTALLRVLVPLLQRVSPVAGQLSADALLGSPRRTSGTVVAMTLSLSFVLGLGGYMGSTKASLVRWMEDILTSDLYVRASTNLVRPDFRFPASVREELLALPGVRAVESYRGARMEFRGSTFQLVTIEIGPMLDRTRHEFLQGDAETMRKGLVDEGKCAVSDNFFRRHGVGVGDAVELPTPSGVVRFPVAAVLRDFTSDRGAVFLDRAVFVRHWKDDRVDTYDVNLHAGADGGAVREAIRKALGGRMPALVSTRSEFTAEIGKAVDAFYALVKITVFLALAVASLGIVTSLLISVAERTREIGILKSLGALGGQLRRSVVFEALALAFVGLTLSLPIGNLMAHFMETTVAEAFAGWRMTHRYPWDILAWLLVALPLVAAVAAWVPARQAARVRVTEAITHE